MSTIKGEEAAMSHLSVKEVVISCGVANSHLGELKLLYMFMPAADNEFLFVVTAQSYKFSPNTGKNIARFRFRIGKADQSGTTYGIWYTSPASLEQDAQWHDHLVGLSWPTTDKGIIEVEFMYDPVGGGVIKPCVSTRLFER
ncbi:hypothetical protein [Pseudomonas batumici]|uniref:hypothetical protein n=1 Tax=Pseudomonas batumici TaxID=226910 RepID=UPI000589D18D|nr:hypothetical protein [Pseudomonas batumici]